MIDDVVAAEAARCEALRAGNWVALEAFLDDDFTYTHASGRVENKTEWMTNVREPARSIVWEDTKVRRIGDVALLSGRQTYTIDQPDAPIVTDLLVLQVWVHEQGWRLLTQHNTWRAKERSEPRPESKP